MLDATDMNFSITGLQNSDAVSGYQISWCEPPLPLAMSSWAKLDLDSQKEDLPGAVKDATTQMGRETSWAAFGSRKAVLFSKECSGHEGQLTLLVHILEDCNCLQLEPLPWGRPPVHWLSVSAHFDARFHAVTFRPIKLGPICKQ
jgi:hypothetical protein